MPGRITLKTIDKRVGQMRDLVAENGRPMPVVGVVPPTTIAETEEEARRDVVRFVSPSSCRKKWETQVSTFPWP